MTGSRPIEATRTSPRSSTIGSAQTTHARWIVVGLGALVLFALLPFISGLLGAIVLTIAAQPLHRRLTLRVGARGASLLLAVAALMLVLLPGVIMIVTLFAQTPSALAAVTNSALLQRIGEVHIGNVDVGGVARTMADAATAWASRQALAMLGSITLATLNVVIALFGFYYLSLAGANAWRVMARVLPFDDATQEQLAAQFRTTTEAMLLGIAFTALAQGMVVGLSFVLVDLPDAAFWGFVTACVSILPVLGSALVWLPATLVLMIDHRYGAALVIGGIGMVVASNIDNVIRPLVYRRLSHIHPMITLVGAFAGVRLFGIAGLLLGPLGISYLIALAQASGVQHSGD